ncbi:MULTISPECIES: hypothetical protein [Nostocales]|uniref:Uncharacterized protein n=3 Tax=Nostocales TaxID=1161 RepID=A0A8S9T936_9CYAN|nr:hypothetical protein [Tolypothrix bouteillei]KAF3888164.1 hypothetical protein DA73_0400023725 [Tolypothrix bouteillei VB521301]
MNEIPFFTLVILELGFFIWFSRKKTILQAILFSILVATITLFARLFQLTLLAIFFVNFTILLAILIFFIGLSWSVVYLVKRWQQRRYTSIPLAIILFSWILSSYISPVQVEFLLYAKTRNGIVSELATGKLIPKPLSAADIRRRTPNEKPPTAAQVNNFTSLWRNNLLGCDGLGMPRQIKLPRGLLTSTGRNAVSVLRKDAKALVVKFLVSSYGLGDGDNSFIYSSDKTLDIPAKTTIQNYDRNSSTSQKAIDIQTALCSQEHFFHAEQIAKNWFFVSAGY